MSHIKESCTSESCHAQPIADGMAQNLEILSKNLQFITRRSRILMGLIIDNMLSPVADCKSRGQNSGTLTKF